jgi:tetratricopeptide (TPR) repeat protein
MLNRISFLLTCALFSCACFAQTLPDAQALLSQQKYQEAATAFQTLTSADANNGAAWLGLGQALENLKQTDKAVAAYQRVIDLKSAPKLAMASIARAYAAAGNQEKSYEWLVRLADSGTPPGLRGIINGAPQFAGMREQPRFKELQEKMTPCNSPEYHQFDFWLGNWDVHAPNDGPVLGHSSITSVNDGCIVQEQWTSLRIEKGTSFNYYDNRDKKWHQIYFDNSGNMGNYPPMSGNLIDGRLVFMTDASQSPLARWTFYPLDAGGKKVRQWAEQSTDGGKTWTTTWDSVYVKQ